MNVIPDYTDGKIHVSLSGKNELKSISLLDLTGKRIQTRNSLPAELEIPVDDGIYFVHVLTSAGELTKKIVISRR